MIELYFWTTPNGYKPLLFLEETGIDYQLRPVNISKGEQFEPAFLKISPNNRIPAIVDDDPQDGGTPLALTEQMRTRPHTTTRLRGSLDSTSRPLSVIRKVSI